MRRACNMPAKIYVCIYHDGIDSQQGIIVIEKQSLKLQFYLNPLDGVYSTTQRTFFDRQTGIGRSLQSLSHLRC